MPRHHSVLLENTPPFMRLLWFCSFMPDFHRCGKKHTVMFAFNHVLNCTQSSDHCLHISYGADSSQAEQNAAMNVWFRSLKGSCPFIACRSQGADPDEGTHTVCFQRE